MFFNTPSSNIVNQIYKLSQGSLAELARNSVIQSGWEMEVKRYWLAQDWYLPGSAGNDITKVGALVYIAKYEETKALLLIAITSRTTDQCSRYSITVST